MGSPRGTRDDSGLSCRSQKRDPNRPAQIYADYRLQFTESGVAGVRTGGLAACNDWTAPGPYGHDRQGSSRTCLGCCPSVFRCRVRTTTRPERLDRCQSHVHSLVNAKRNIWRLQGGTTQNPAENKFFFAGEDGETFLARAGATPRMGSHRSATNRDEMPAVCKPPSPNPFDDSSYNKTRHSVRRSPLPAASPPTRGQSYAAPAARFAISSYIDGK